MDKKDLISSLYDELEKYIQIRNKNIKLLVTNLYKISGDSFIKDNRLVDLYSKHSEVKKLLEYFLTDAKKKISQEKEIPKPEKVKKYNNQNYEKSYYNEYYDCDDRDIGFEENVDNYTPYNTNEEYYDDGSSTYDENEFYYN